MTMTVAIVQEEELMVAEKNVANLRPGKVKRLNYILI
jgi:hypothetical protein